MPKSDLDFLIFGGDGFRLTEILFSLISYKEVYGLEEML